MSLQTSDWNAVVGKLNDFATEIAKLKSIVKHHQPGVGGEGQSIVRVKVVSIQTGAATTYTVKPAYGPSPTLSNWQIAGVLSANPSVTFAVNDYVILILNNAGNSYITGTTSGSASVSATVPRHTHSGYEDGGYAGAFSGGR